MEGTRSSACQGRDTTRFIVVQKIEYYICIRQKWGNRAKNQDAAPIVPHVRSPCDVCRQAGNFKCGDKIIYPKKKEKKEIT